MVPPINLGCRFATVGSSHSRSNFITSQDVTPTMDQFKADAVRMNNNPTGETAVMDKAIESNFLSVDQYAEQLMDDLFQGIEHSLETGEVLEEEVQTATVQTFATPTAAPLSVVVPTESALPETVAPPSEEAETASDAAATEAKPDWSLRILWAAALLSCVGAVALCISNWGSYKDLFQQVTGQAPAPEVLASAPTPTVAEAPNQAFANYIQQSLEALNDQQPTATTGLAGLTSPVVAAAPAPVAPVAPVTPTIPGGLGTAPAAVPPGTILERVYIPVYQTPQGLVPVVPGVPVPNLTATNGSFLPSPPAVVAPSAVVQPGAAIAVAPQPQASQAAAPVEPAETIAVQPLATTEHTLVGLLELGDSSAALFEVSGVTRRFSLGERIGSSGWTLVEVQNSEAIVRRNGEIRSVFVGQTF